MTNWPHHSIAAPLVVELLDGAVAWFDRTHSLNDGREVHGVGKCLVKPANPGSVQGR
jgi:hypothetical protein